jgi:hypothetical protein
MGPHGHTFCGEEQGEPSTHRKRSVSPSFRRRISVTITNWSGRQQRAETVSRNTIAIVNVAICMLILGVYGADTLVDSAWHQDNISIESRDHLDYTTAGHSSQL